MQHETYLCPQCGAALPRQAYWRTVTCIYCAAVFTKKHAVVEAASFHQAYLRMMRTGERQPNSVLCGGRRYRVLKQLGAGSTAEVFLAERVGAMAERVVLKIANHEGMQKNNLRMEQEREVLQRLQAIQSPGAAYFSQRLPQASHHGKVKDSQVLVMRNHAGFTASLADVRRHYPNGIDARHAVWMWRRVLEVLAYTHSNGWAHNGLAAEHLLVHPQDHGVLIIGWAGATFQVSSAAIGRDLMRSAAAIRSLLAEQNFHSSMSTALSTATPAALAELLQQASEDGDWCARHGAQGIDQELKTVARTVFGAPQFVHFKLNPRF